MTFENLKINENILKALKRLGFEAPTPIQKRCIPLIFEGRDVVGQSLTGSGKTAAFGIPIVQKLVHGAGIQALIMTPTRELAVQVKDNIQKYSTYQKLSITAVYGGVSMGPQYDALRHADIVVATPGRLLDHMQRNTIKTNNIKILVLDEADKMLEMGFIDDIKRIMSALSKERQTLLFSATLSGEIQKIIKFYLKNPEFVKEKIHVDKSLLKQIYFNVKPHDKFSLLVHLLKNKTPGLAIVFCATRNEVDVLTQNLKRNGISSMAVHGGLSQNIRSRAVDQLKNENIQVLVATDVAARGLDINNISHIYNYDCSKNSEEYTHRIGRTARAGKAGEAVTILSQKDHDNFSNIIRDRNLVIVKEELPIFEKIDFIREAPQRRGGFGGGHGGHRGGGARPGRFNRQKPRFGGR